MTATAIASLNALATSLNDGTPATFTPADTVARLTAMEAHATAMGVTIGEAENKLAESAKAFGCDFLNLNKVHGIDGDTLASRARDALGWADLAGPAGSKVKTCFNTMRSRLGIVAGRWNELDVTVRNELLGGLRSYNTVYDMLAKADRDAKRAKDAEKAAAEKALADAAAAAGNDNKGDAKPAPVEAPDFFALIATLRGMIDPAMLTSAHVEAVNALAADVDAAAALINGDDDAPVMAVAA